MLHIQVNISGDTKALKKMLKIVRFLMGHLMHLSKVMYFKKVVQNTRCLYIFASILIGCLAYFRYPLIAENVRYFRK